MQKQQEKEINIFGFTFIQYGDDLKSKSLLDAGDYHDLAHFILGDEEIDKEVQLQKINEYFSQFGELKDESSIKEIAYLTYLMR